MTAEPTPTQPHLHVVACDGCERKDRMIGAMQVDLDNLEVDCKVKRRRISQLENELAKERREHPDYGTAQAVFEFWRSKCRPGARSFGVDREKAVLGRLNDKVPGTEEKAYTPRYICEAIVGAYVEPFVDPKTGKLHNDLELICRTPRKLEDFHDRYERWKARQA